MLLAAAPFCVAGSADGFGYDKCPVCGAFVYKHPEKAAFIYYEKSGKMRYLAFDGAADMMKFYLEPNRWGDFGNIKMHILKIVVRDHSSKKPILAKRAWYVYIAAPGKKGLKVELVPFETKQAAEEFKDSRNGKIVLRFGEISKRVLYAEE